MANASRVVYFAQEGSMETQLVSLEAIVQTIVREEGTVIK